MELKSKKELSPEEKENRWWRAAFACFTLGLVFAIGERKGMRRTHKAISNGIGKMWVVDPTLKEHMWDVISKIDRNR